MNNIIEYHVVDSLESHMRGMHDFIQTVNRKIAEGWQPIGGIISGFERSLCQAMVKYEEEKQ